MAIPDSYLDQLTARCDIVETVSRYVSLKKSGSNYFGVCPFHNEKTPSFSVAPDKQIFHCFGCGEGGGVIQFIMKIENLPFIEAVKLLSERCGMQMPDDAQQSDEMRRARQRMLDINKEAARHFHDNLFQKCGEQAIEYVKRRRLDKKTVVSFGLGYAQNTWDSLVNYLVSKGYTKAEIEQAGLAVRNSSGGLYDRFRNRLMFPIIDIRGNVVAFGGRVMDDSTPKYLNSPETLVFQKNRNLFALNVAKKTKRGKLILAEGYMDVIALHQAGFDSAVASLGTSLTQEQAKLISRYVPEVVICYDSDGAGQKAANRAIEILSKTGVTVRVLKLPGAKDPDEYIKMNGAEAFLLLLNKPQTDSEYKLNQIKDKYDLSQDEQRISFLKDASFMLAKIQSGVECEIYSRNAAKDAGVTEAAMMAEVKRARNALFRQNKKNTNTQATAPVRHHETSAKEMKYENISSAICEELLLVHAISDPELLERASAGIQPEEFSSSILASIYSHILELHRNGLEVQIGSCLNGLNDGQISHITRVLAESVRSQNPESAMDDYIAQIKYKNAKNIDGADKVMLALEKQRKGIGRKA